MWRLCQLRATSSGRQVIDLGLLLAPLARLEFVGRAAGAAKKFLHLIALLLGAVAEDAEELARVGLGIDWRDVGGVTTLINDLIDAKDGFLDADRFILILEDLPVVPREVLQRLAAFNNRKIRRRKTFLRVTLQEILKLFHILKHLAAHTRP